MASRDTYPVTVSTLDTRITIEISSCLEPKGYSLALGQERDEVTRFEWCPLHPSHLGTCRGLVTGGNTTHLDHMHGQQSLVIVQQEQEQQEQEHAPHTSTHYRWLP